MASTINTKKTERRRVRFTTMRDLLAEIDRVEESHTAGTLRTSGNWTAAQVLHHVALLMKHSLDGFDFTAPWILRTIGPRIKHRVLRRPMPAGVRLRGASRALVPDEGVRFDDAAELLRAQIRRVMGGERMTKPSPVFGPMTHEEWTLLHLNHAAHHLGYLHPGGPAGSGRRAEGEAVQRAG